FAKRVEGVGVALEASLPARRNPGVGARQDPWRGALEQMELADVRLDLGHELNGRGAGSNHRHLAACEVVVMIPARGMENRAAEAVTAFEVRDLGVSQRADGGDGDLGRERALAGLDFPALLVLVPAHRLDLVVEAQVRAEPLAGDHAAHVVPDLGLAGKGATPARVLLIRPGIEDARDIAGTPGVSVVTPGPAELGGALEYDEVVHPGLLQRHCHAQAGEAGTCDHDLVVGDIERRAHLRLQACEVGTYTYHGTLAYQAATRRYNAPPASGPRGRAA